MSDLQGLITESTSVTFQRITRPVSPSPFSLQQQRQKKNEVIPIHRVSYPPSSGEISETEGGLLRAEPYDFSDWMFLAIWEVTSGQKPATRIIGNDQMRQRVS